MATDPTGIRLELWQEDDLPLLTALLGDAEMTRFLGGPESRFQLAGRHQKYLRENREGTTRMYRVVDKASGEAIGSVGSWPIEHEGDRAWEAGWAVKREWQGRGIATVAVRLLQTALIGDDRIAILHAYPNIHNAASNAICRKTDFVLLGAKDGEYPAGNPVTFNHWVWTVPRP